MKKLATFLNAWNMLISSVDPEVAAAAAATDSCTNFPAVVAVVPLVRLAIVGSAITLPPESIASPYELTLSKRRGKTMRRSAGEGRNEVMLVNAPAVAAMPAWGDEVQLPVTRDRGSSGASDSPIDLSASFLPRQVHQTQGSSVGHVC